MCNCVVVKLPVCRNPTGCRDPAGAGTEQPLQGNRLGTEGWAAALLKGPAAPGVNSGVNPSQKLSLLYQCYNSASVSLQ